MSCFLATERGADCAPLTLSSVRITYHSRRLAMKRLTIVAVGAMLLLLAGTGTGFAQVKRIEMKIDGYLCGN